MTARDVQNSSHASAILASRSHLVYRIDGQKQGQDYWAYALIDAGKLDAFKKMMETGHIHVQEYGKVLAWGLGIDPPEEVRQMLKDSYHFDLIC